MYAFINWHRRDAAVDAGTYRERLLAFYPRLGASGGLQALAVATVDSAPWLPGAAECYEEWYLLQDMLALEHLNEAAVAGQCEQPHAAVAAAAGENVSGLYRHQWGTVAVADCGHGLWFGKPRGIRYRDFLGALQPWLEASGGSLWSRFAGLSPAPEFCLLSPEAIVTGEGTGTIQAPQAAARTPAFPQP